MAYTNTAGPITIREARLGDKKAVLDINRNVYDGDDYLPHYYEKFVACPLSKCYVAFNNKTAVGFVIATVVDGGQAYNISRAARVSPDMEGKGVYKQLNDYIQKDVGVKTETVCVEDCNPCLLKDSFRLRYNEILRKNFYSFELCISQKHAPLIDKHLEVLQTVNEKDFKSLICSKEISKYLFPEDRIVAYWAPHKVMTSNIPSVLWHGSTVYSDLVSGQDGAVQGLLSIGTVFPCIKRHVVLNIDIYGADSATFKAHLTRHIVNLQKNHAGRAVVYICAEEKLGVRDQEVKERLSDLSSKSSIFINESKFYIFEKE